ncbi:MAG: DNA polymerase IV [Clostridiales bacterium]|nr:DNA polymerase IV [Clostridiales bacterium]
MKKFILHSDLNNFYASVESLYNPEIRNKAVVVVGDEEKRHGIVLAKNYVAKSFGIATGDTVWEAKQKCGCELVCVPARFDLYLKISKMVKDIYREYSSRVESFGIDEAWIDISDIASNYEEALKIANNIRCRIISEIGLTVSIGLSFNKIFAKLGSDLEKPNGMVVITEDNYKDKVWGLPASDLLYVGRATTKKLIRGNIKTIGDIATADIKYLKLTLGKMGEVLWKFANGLDDSEVTKVGDKEKIKSFGNSTTCPIDLTDVAQVKSIIYMLSESVAERMKEKGVFATTISLWVKDTELKSFDRQMHVSPTNISEDIAKSCYKLFLENFNWKLDVRALGVRASGICEDEIQYNIFQKEHPKKECLERTIENLRSRFGYNIIRRGNILAYDSLSPLNPHSEIHIIHPRGFFKSK